MAELRLLSYLEPNCSSALDAESETVAHEWREIGSDSVQQYDQCARCGCTEPWADHPWRAGPETPVRGGDDALSPTGHHVTGGERPAAPSSPPVTHGRQP